MANIVGAVASTDPSSNAQVNSLGLQDFLNVLMTQLTYQDPLKPMDNEEFMAQLAQFTALGQTQQINTNVGALLSTQASLSSVGLIGRAVTISTNSGNVSGTVSDLSLTGDTPTMTVQTSSGALTGVTMSQLVSVDTSVSGGTDTGTGD